MTAILRKHLPANQRAALDSSRNPSSLNFYLTHNDLDPRIIMVESNGRRSELGQFSTTTATGTPNATLYVYGVHNYDPAVRVAELAQNVTLVLMPGSEVVMKELYTAGNNLSSSVPYANTICGAGKLTCSLTYGPGIKELYVDGIEFNGTINPFSYGGGQNVTPRKLRVTNCRLRPPGAGAVLNTNYGFGANYYTYIEAEFVGNRITAPTSPSLFIFSDTHNIENPAPVPLEDPNAESKNVLRLIDNVIEAPAPAIVVPTNLGRFSYQAGVNYYLGGVLPPAIVRDARLLTDCPCEGTGTGGGTTPAAPTDLGVDSEGFVSFTPAAGKTASDYEHQYTAN